MTILLFNVWFTFQNFEHLLRLNPFLLHNLFSAKVGDLVETSKLFWSILIIFVKFWSIWGNLLFLCYFCILYEEVQHRSIGGTEPHRGSGSFKQWRCYWTGEEEVSKVRDCAGWFWLQSDRNQRERWKIRVSACSFQKKWLPLHSFWDSSWAQNDIVEN